MSLIPYYLQYVSEICEGTRKAPAGIVLTEQEDLKRRCNCRPRSRSWAFPPLSKPAPRLTGRKFRRRNMTASTRLS